MLYWRYLRHVFSLGEESRHVQVERVGLGLARCNKNSALVTKVMSELAQCPEISLAHFWVPHQRLCALQIHEAQQSKQIGVLNYPRLRIIYLALKTKNS
jgi:hypothetical protein